MPTAMPWNPEKYNTFKHVRYQPFFDLMELISGDHLKKGIDIGCGTGEQTSFLARKFGQARFLGIDPSPEMLSESKKFESGNLSFEKSTVEEFVASDTEQNWDLVFSNAALQWSENHYELFPELIAKTGDGGQFAVQMPFQKENTLNRILIEMVSEKPFVDALDGFCRNSPLLQVDDYAGMMYAGGLKDLNIFVKVYPIIAKHDMDLYHFISGSSLIPYMERLGEEEQLLFRSEFIRRIKKHFISFPAIYAFKRLLLYGVRG
ncbi:methyltransferase domain-containing protein [Sinomicrobium sp. M5D2P17]